MIQFVTGVPGSGKSYYGIFNLAINFAKDLKDNKKFRSFALSKTKYKASLTNLNELKLDKFENVKPLDFNHFKIQLQKLYNLYKLGKTDSELEDEMKDEDFFYTLIILDECHNFLNKDDEVLVWWLSYHRHFHQDIILITQDIPLVNTKYKAFTEFYYKAIPASRKLFNTQMVYHQFTAHQMFKTQKATTKKLPIVKEIFNLYGSGENNTQKSLVKHYLLIALIILIFLLFGGYYFISHFFGAKDDIKIDNSFAAAKPIDKNTNNSKLSLLPKSKDVVNDEKKLIEIRCIKLLCYFDKKVFDRKFVDNLFNSKDYKTELLQKIDNTYYLLIFDKYNLFNKTEIDFNEKDIQNEKNTNIIDFFKNNQ